MQLNPEHLAKQLGSGIAPLYVILGDELLLAMEIADEIRRQAGSDGYAEREVLTVDPRFDWAHLKRWRCQSSLFGERRMLELRIPTGKPGREGGAAIEMFCRNLPADTVTVVMLPGVDRQGQASKWFKVLEQTGLVIAVPSVKRAQLAGWIAQRLQRQGQSADRDVLQFFVDKVEGNLLAAHQEIKKLALLYPSGRLSFEQVKNAILDVARYDVLQLSEALLMADMVRYSRILSGLQGEGAALPLILAVLAEQIRVLLKICLAVDAKRGGALAQIMKVQRVWPSQQKLIAHALQHADRQLLMGALRHAAHIDRIIKGVVQGDAWEALLQLGMHFAGHRNLYARRLSENSDRSEGEAG
ncbi:DNA polymerase III subunit delta [Nitrosomonas sp. ANs5]|uniref:DNA polymerase III subunit delta n=1 Tax=Nitrosomonas sp. ANs5 TaxID=3423941 RepID=UPI003D32FCBE